jgi:proteasome accessory factor B
MTGSAQDRKLERLLNLLAMLLDANRPLTRADIVAKVEGYPEGEQAERKAFNRDVQELQRMGVPVESTDEGTPTYRVRPEAYRLPDPGLTPEEAAALQLALATVGLDLPEGSPEEALWKLTGGAASTIEPPAATATVPGHEHLAEIWRATNERRRLRFTYKGAERDVEPWNLTFTKGRWYVQGLDPQRAEERLFRLDRIEGPPAVGDTPAAFTRPDDRRPAGPPPPWLLGEEVLFTATVLIDAAQADLVRQAHGITVATEHPDGSIEVRMEVANPEGFRTYVLSLLDHATVLDPPEARADVVRWLEAMAPA